MLAELRNGEVPNVVEAVAFPNKEAGLVAEGTVSAGLDWPCCPKSERPLEAPVEPPPSVVAGFAPNIEEGSAGFAAPKRDAAGF